MSNLSYKTISEIVDDGFSKFNLRRWLPRKFRWFGSSSSPASLLCGMLCVASSSLTVLFCSLNWEMEIWAFNNAIIKKQQRRSWEARKKRRAREQQLVTHFLRSRQEPDQGVLAFFASSALIPLTVFNKEVDPPIHSFWSPWKAENFT